MLSRFKTLLAVTTLCLISACAVLGVPPLETPGDKLVAGYVTIAGARQLNTTLINGKRLGSADGLNVQKQLDTAREGLDVASTLSGVDLANKVAATMAIVDASLVYLCTKAPTDANCQARSKP